MWTNGGDAEMRQVLAEMVGDAESRKLLGDAASKGDARSAVEKGDAESADRGEGDAKLAKYERAVRKKIRLLEARGLSGGGDAKLAQLRAELQSARETAQEYRSGSEGAQGGGAGREKSQEAHEGTRAGLPPTPLAWKALGLHAAVGAALSSRSLSSPTQIQELTIRTALVDGRDVIGIAETGAGKTLAYALPIAHYVHTERDLAACAGVDAPTGVRGLVICPTRELSIQVAEQVKFRLCFPVPDVRCGAPRERCRSRSWGRRDLSSRKRAFVMGKRAFVLRKRAFARGKRAFVPVVCLARWLSIKGAKRDEFRLDFASPALGETAPGAWIAGEKLTWRCMFLVLVWAGEFSAEGGCCFDCWGRQALVGRGLGGGDV